MKSTKIGIQWILLKQQFTGGLNGAHVKRALGIDKLPLEHYWHLWNWSKKKKCILWLLLPRRATRFLEVKPSLETGSLIFTGVCCVVLVGLVLFCACEVWWKPTTGGNFRWFLFFLSVQISFINFTSAKQMKSFRYRLHIHVNGYSLPLNLR